MLLLIPFRYIIDSLKFPGGMGNPDFGRIRYLLDADYYVKQKTTPVAIMGWAKTKYTAV
jgi:hypothetical protein